MTRHGLPGSEFQIDLRLVEAGEPVTFTLRGATPQDRLEIFPRYLERCDSERARQSPLPLQWLDGLEREAMAPAEVIRYVPRSPGNYIARWTSRRHGVEHRYFAAIDQTYLIYRPAVWSWPTPFPPTGGPEIHNGGLPLDWCISSDRTDEPYIPRLLEEQQRYGGGIVYGLKVHRDEKPSSESIEALRKAIDGFQRCGLDVGRVCNVWYGGGMSNWKVQAARAAGFDVIDGYVPRADRCGMGAPYSPFYIGATDYRFPSQAGRTDALACVFDFVGSWHFHGPIGFHRPSAKGSWEQARHYIDLAAQEAVRAVHNSGVHSFITTLVNFESPIAWGSPTYQVVWDEERGREFFDRYMHLLAFAHTKRWPIVFARAADYADYFRAHYAEMPRRIVSSITHDIDYDRYWLDEWHEQKLTPSGYVPIAQDLREFRQARVMKNYNMPVSHEFINYNDNRRSCRFEFACPKPVHYYDLTGVEPWDDSPIETDLPDPDMAIHTTTTRDWYEVTFELRGGRSFTDYLLAIWDIPREFRGCRPETNAKEFIWLDNMDGNCRGLVRFDLVPECKIVVRFHCRQEA